ncbi:MAG: GH32 C-terminal domain-containing protein [Prevotella sp.]|nr:GH32 C-terminal domain-containing protein [Prevotella sp.]
MKLKTLLATVCVATYASSLTAQVAHFDMSLNEGKITESVTNTSYSVASQLQPCAAAGLDGQALRFDGYSNYVKAALPSTLSSEALTVSVVLAAETYPMMQTDVAETTPTYTAICGTLDETAKKGFAIELSSQGDLRFRYGSASGFLLSVQGSKKLVRGQWNQLTAVFDKAANAATLYLNGESIGTGRAQRADMAHSTADFYIGRSAEEKKAGLFLINTFCGLIDDIAIYNTATVPDGSSATIPDGSSATVPDGSSSGSSSGPIPDFSYPTSRYAESLWRPQFHAMPTGSWTNETHGMLYSDGRYHLFFQKNANGPYMSRLHWGHISSANLYDWQDEPIAVYPGEPFDIKGCWSGCTYEDDGTPYILYTAVDNEKARIAQTKAADATLARWTDKHIIIDGRPSGLSDDFRDPYFFTASGQQYVIVGTSKNGVGACTLHKLQNGSWTNDGTIFFQGGNANQHGTFWEMPNVTPMCDGKYLFTCTPLGTGVGVRTLCWVGTIGTDGKFTPDASGVQYLEMNGISRDGYGLLSPTILKKDDKTLLLGIVPDKLPTQQNYEMGWAHNYSLPREISLDASGLLVQKPYSGLTAMRTATAATVDETLLGSKALVSGRQIELLGEFTATTGTCGFRFLRNASLTYDADSKRLSLDLTALQRTANDGGSYKGIYETTLTEPLHKLHVFLDASIADIFVNDRWAYSVRLFPTDATAVEAKVFATAATPVKVQAWTLDAKQTTGISDNGKVISDKYASAPVYNLQGMRVGTGHKGLCVQNGRKYVNR